MENSGQPPTILIVEEIDWIRIGMTKAVERQGYRVVEARNEAEVFRFAELQPVDVILTDEEVPTFKNLMARLHQHPTLSSVPVVIINPDAEDGARLGDAYLLTDYADISLLAVVHR